MIRAIVRPAPQGMEVFCKMPVAAPWDDHPG